jgi:hypothetical protein
MKIAVKQLAFKVENWGFFFFFGCFCSLFSVVLGITQSLAYVRQAFYH